MKWRKKTEQSATLEGREKQINETHPIWSSSIDIETKCGNQEYSTLYEGIAVTKIPICRKD